MQLWPATSSTCVYSYVHPLICLCTLDRSNTFLPKTRDWMTVHAIFWIRILRKKSALNTKIWGEFKEELKMWKRCNNTIGYFFHGQFLCRLKLCSKQNVISRLLKFHGLIGAVLSSSVLPSIASLTYTNSAGVLLLNPPIKLYNVI